MSAAEQTGAANTTPSTIEAAADARSESLPEREFLPDGRPKATKRQTKNSGGRERLQPPAGVTNPTEVECLGRDAWLAWHSAFWPVWSAERRAAVGPGMWMLPNAAAAVPIISRHYRVMPAPDPILKEGIAGLDKLYGKQEFVVTPLCAPQTIEKMACVGVFPMTVPLTETLSLPAFKLHMARCVVPLTFKVEELKTLGNSFDVRDVLPPRPVAGVSKQLARRCAVVLDAHVDIAFKMINQHHKNCWLTPELAKAFTAILLNPANFNRIKLHCIVLVDCDLVAAGAPEEEYVVAAEFGYSVGSVYSSLTGAYTMDGAGTLQLAVLKAMLITSGYTVWDLGMGMAYKVKALGGIDIPRRRWVDTCLKLGKEPPMPRGTAAAGVQCPFAACIPQYSRCDVVIAQAAALTSAL